MWLRSGLFQICIFVAYSVKDINNVEIDTGRLYKRKTKNFKNIINRASSFLHEYYLLKNEYASDYIENDYENYLVVNELKNILKDARTYLKGKDNETPQGILENNAIENRISNRIRNDIPNQKLLEYIKLNDDLATWTKNNELSRAFTAVNLWKNLIAIVKRLLDDKKTIIIYKDGGMNMGKWLQRVLKKFYTPSIAFVVLGPRSSKPRLALSNEADISALKYAKEDQENESGRLLRLLNRLEKIEGVKENQNGNDIKDKLLKDTNDGTLRGGCIECNVVLLRKCNKILKVSIKNACRIYPCKSRFKQMFIGNAKSACSYYYLDQKNHKINCEEPNANKSKNFKDKTRSSADNCERSLSLRELNLRDEHKEWSGKDYVVLNILRDKYEKACEKALHDKCKKACVCALRETCKVSGCHEKHKKQVSKDCKAQCKAHFPIKGSSSDESSDSDSGSKSEEETEDSKDRS